MTIEPVELYKWQVDDTKRSTIEGMAANAAKTEEAINELATTSITNDVIQQIQYNVKDAEFGALGNYRLSPTTGKPATGFPENDPLDDAPAIQRAFDRCRAEGGGIVYFPMGNYPIKSILRVYKNTKVILHPNARIIRNNRISVFFTNGDGIEQPTAYSGQGNIIFSGGIMDGNIANFDWRFNFFSIGHADGILFENMQMLDMQTYHAIELNAVRRARIVNCLFDGWTLDSTFAISTPDRRSEAIQFDGMVDSTVFGQFGAYDKTFCEDIEVTGCTFRRWDRGVGSHTGYTGRFHKDIRITNNHFEDIADIAIVTCMWDGTVIDGNTFRRVGGGVWIRLKDSTDDTSNYVISNNTFRDVVVGSSARHAIRVNGLDGTTKKVHSVSIIGNVIDNSAQTAVYLQGISRLTVANNVVLNSSAGIYLINCDEGTVSGNSVSLIMTNSGISLSASTWINVTGNVLNKIGAHGIVLLEGSTNNVVSNNGIREVSMAAAQGSQGIYIASASNSVIISSNTVKSGKPENAIWVTSTCVNCLLTNNHTVGLVFKNNSTTSKEFNNFTAV